MTPPHPTREEKKEDFWFEPWDFEGLRERTRRFNEYLEMKKREIFSSPPIKQKKK